MSGGGLAEEHNGVMDTYGITSANVDISISPKDDLFRHVNGSWLKNCSIPAEKAGWGSFHELGEKVEMQIKNIILEITATLESELTFEQLLIKRLYSAYLNEEKIAEIGVKEVTILLNKIAKIANLAEFYETLGEMGYYEADSLFSVYYSFDSGDSSRMLPHFNQSGISLPDERYYREEEFNSIKEGLVSHIEKMFGLFGLEIDAQALVDYESKVAAFHWDQVKDREAELTYNLMSFAQLQERTPGIHWAQYLKGLGVEIKNHDTVVVNQPSFFTELSSFIPTVDLEILKSWLSWSLISGLASYLTKEIIEEDFRFFATELDGVQEKEERWKDAIEFVEACAGEAVGAQYVARHYSAEAGAKMKVMINYLIQAYESSIKELTWMSEETKVKALEKLSKFTPKVGAPEKFQDYTDLIITSEMSLLEIIFAVNRYGFMRDWVEGSKPVDRSKWYITPQTVNAYYMASMNEIVFPAAILQAPFFDPNWDDAVNYGAIGAIIGHEIGHGFDDQGSKYDGDGNLNRWWGNSDLENFELLTAKLIAQYNALAVDENPELKVNGEFTVGENIGDLAGLSIAYKAYLMAKSEQECKDYEKGLSDHALFFMGWAQAWKGKVRQEAIKNDIATDPHAPNEFRCNQIVRNLEAYYLAFEVSSQDKMYLPPQERVLIW